jgi:hypothetical protein
MGISTWRFRIYTIDGSKYCSNNMYNNRMIAPRRHRLQSSGANRLSDVAVPVNFIAEFTLMAVHPIIECFSQDLVPQYCHGLESTTGYSVSAILWNPFMVSQIGVSLACHYLYMVVKLFVPS